MYCLVRISGRMDADTDGRGHSKKASEKLRLYSDFKIPNLIFAGVEKRNRFCLQRFPQWTLQY